MVQNSRTWSVVWAILLRLVFLCVAGVAAFYTSPLTIEFLNNKLNYQLPSGFFGYSFADWGLGLTLAFTFWSSLLFGTLGKKVDYFFISLFISLGVWEWSGTENVTLQIWLTLIGTLIIGNLIGFALKLLRQRFLPKLKI